MHGKEENQTVFHDRNDHMEEKHYHRRSRTGPLLRSTGHLPGPDKIAHTQILANPSKSH